MDFSLSDEQEAVRTVAAQILDGRLTPERRKEVEASDDRFDRGLWSDLAAANLLGLSVPEAAGGSGLGFLASALVLEQIGRTGAPVPYLASVVMGSMAIAEFGTGEQLTRLVAPAVAGDLVLTAALVEPGTDPARPITRARPNGDGGWHIDGAKTCVPAGLVADRALVPATTDNGVVVLIVDLEAAGVRRTKLDTTSGQPEARLEFTGVSVPAGDVLADPDHGAEVVDWTVERANAGLCAIAVGVCEEALRLTADYTKTRTQFDKPIASFQAVGQRAAEAYIDTEAVRLTARAAAWRLDAGMPAADAVAVAKFWAADGGQRVVHAAQHLHGGVGVDRDYPLHRCFLWAKQLELTLGGSTTQLRRLGAMLADEPA